MFGGARAGGGLISHLSQTESPKLGAEYVETPECDGEETSIEDSAEPSDKPRCIGTFANA